MLAASAAAFCFSGSASFAAEIGGDTACKLIKGEAVTVSSVADGETVLLDDGRALRLAGIQAPRPGTGRAWAWPLADKAREELRALVAGKTFRLRYDRARSDRHGRILAFLSPAEGGTVQARMIEAGLARVMPTRDARNCAGALLAAEDRARSARRGIWADSFYAVRDARDTKMLARLEGSYQLVEGTVTSATAIRGRIYINFGDDWREDFTVTVASTDVRLFKAGPWARLAEDATAIGAILNGRKLRVRGAVGRFNGPDMTIAVPEQIEFLVGRNVARGGDGEGAGSE